MLSYINYNVFSFLVAVMVVFNALIVYVSPAAAEIAVKNKKSDSIPVLYFTYNDEDNKYKHFTADSELIAGRKAKIVYDVKRKSVLFNNNSTVYMRYSYDFWQSCQDIELKADASGALTAIIKVPASVSTIQVAFFAAYPYNDYKSWGYIWDSNYGKNFTIKLITQKELDAKRKFDELNSIKG